MSVKSIKKETVEAKKISNAEAIKDLEKQVIHLFWKIIHLKRN